MHPEVLDPHCGNLLIDARHVYPGAASSRSKLDTYEIRAQLLCFATRIREKIEKSIVALPRAVIWGADHECDIRFQHVSRLR